MARGEAQQHTGNHAGGDASTAAHMRVGESIGGRSDLLLLVCLTSYRTRPLRGARPLGAYPAVILHPQKNLREVPELPLTAANSFFFSRCLFLSFSLSFVFVCM